MAGLLNRLIAKGSTTAHAQPFSPDGFARHFLDGPDVILCHLAEYGGRMAGFQSLSRHPALGMAEADIGTFTDPDHQGRGFGAALFAATRTASAAHGIAAIIAVIRADNRAGLRYYTGLGFRPVRIWRAVPLASGKKVDRIAHQRIL